MQKKILVFVAILVVVVIGWELYTHNSEKTGLGSGAVFDAGSSKDGVDNNTDLDGKPLGTVGPTPTRSDAPGTVNGEPVAGAKPSPANDHPIDALKNRIDEHIDGRSPSATPSSLPVSDTIAPNPPNGLAFGGTGKFQWYRQGNITWRVNTESGAACIAFATQEEWLKPIVYSHGCGNS